MLFGVGVLCRISVLNYLIVILSYLGLIFLLLITRNCVVSVPRVFSFSWYLGQAALFDCSAPWAFHITIFLLAWISISIKIKLILQVKDV